MESISKEGLPDFYILTRTSGRPHYFYQCVESVAKQDYPVEKIHHIVSYDDSETWNYVEPYHSRAVVEAHRVEKLGDARTNDYFPYNLYLNRLLKVVKGKIEGMERGGGWVMFLDDDDVMAHDRVLSEIAKKIVGERLGKDRVILWQVGFPKGRMVPKRIGFPPRVGEISMIGIGFHVGMIDRVTFDSRKGGDYRLARYLYHPKAKEGLKLKPFWFQTGKGDCFTRINYDQVRRSGSGKRNDLRLNNVQMGEYESWLKGISENMSTSALGRRSLKLSIKPGKKVKEDDDDAEESEAQQSANKELLRLKKKMGIMKQRRAGETNIEEAVAEAEKVVEAEAEKVVEAEAEKVVEAEAEKVVEVEAEAEKVVEVEAEAEKVVEAEAEKVVEVEKVVSEEEVVTGSSGGDVRKIVREEMEAVIGSDLFKGVIREVLLESVEVSRGVKKVSFAENVDGKGGKSEVGSAQRQLTQLLEKEAKASKEDLPEERKLTNLLSHYADAEMSKSAVPEFALIDDFFDAIWVLNLKGKASETQYKLGEFGFTQIKVYDGNPKKSFYDNLWDLCKIAQKKGCRHFAVFEDGMIFNKKFEAEVLNHYENIKNKDWKMIAVGASQNLTTKSSVDWKFYLDTYPDLRKHKITNEAAATKHWKIYGSREKRYSQRNMLHPDTMGGISAVFVSDRIYPDLPKLQKARHASEFLMKNYRSKCYALSPLLALSTLTRSVRQRNRANLTMYRLE